MRLLFVRHQLCLGGKSPIADEAHFAQIMDLVRFGKGRAPNWAQIGIFADAYQLVVNNRIDTSSGEGPGKIQRAASHSPDPAGSRVDVQFAAVSNRHRDRRWRFTPAAHADLV